MNKWIMKLTKDLLSLIKLMKEEIKIKKRISL